MLPAVQAQAGPLPLPTPGQLFERQQGMKAASSLLTRDASDYVAGFSHRVNALAPEAVFSPLWVNGYSPFEKVAYAVYRFDLHARVGRPVVHTQWSHAPGDYTRLWIGASNWQKDHWDWYSGAPAGVVQTVAGSLDLYRRPQTDEMYVAVVLLSQTSSILRKIWLSGFSMRGDWWMCGREPGHASCSPWVGPDSPVVKWQCNLGQGITAGQPVYDADGAIYLGAGTGGASTRMVFAFNPDGSQKWVRPLVVPDDTGPVKSSPAIDDDGTIYFALHDGPLYALAPGSSQKWTFSGYKGVDRSPAIGPDGTTYVVGLAGDSFTESYLHAVDKAGALKWECYFGEGSVTAPAIAADGTVFIGTWDGKLYAFKPGGTVKWTFVAGASIASDPSVGGDGMVYFSSAEPVFYAVNADCTLAWSFPLAASASTAASVGPDGAVYVPCNDELLYAFNADGTSRWSYRAGKCSAAPSIDANGTVYVSSLDSRLYAIDAAGALKWWFVATGPISAPPVLAEDGSLYIVDGGGMLYAIGPGSEVEEHTISGYVKDDLDAGLDGVTVTISGEAPVVTDADGFWSKSGLADGAYLVSPIKDGYDFSPLFDVASVSGDDVTVADFIGSTQPPPVWPMWGLDRAHTRRSPHVGPDDATVKWSTPLPGESVRSQPVIGSDGVIYVQCVSGMLYAINPDGTVRWNTTLNFPSPATPAIAPDGTVYSSSQGNLLFAFTPGGVYEWSYACSTRGSPVIAADGAIIHNVMANSVCAVDADGAFRWLYDSGASAGSDAAPAIADDGTIYLGNAVDAIFALNPDGTLKWSFAADSGGEANPPQTSAAVGADGTVYMALGTNFYAINPDGTQKWVYPVGVDVLSSPAIGDDGTLYLGTIVDKTLIAGRFIALNPDGTLQWQYEAGGEIVSPIESSPAVDGVGTVYVCVKFSGTLMAFNPDGSVKWSFGTAGPASSSPAIGEDGTVYFGNDAGSVYALGPGAG
jgi:outer membrane protein assembly factor BamB